MYCVVWEWGTEYSSTEYITTVKLNKKVYLVKKLIQNLPEIN